jgi:signal transduction histidine kinase
MSAATQFPWMPSDSEPETRVEVELRAVFEHAPFGVARLQPSGEILPLNAAMNRMFGTSSLHTQTALRMVDIFPAGEGAEDNRCLHDLLDGKRDDLFVDSRTLDSKTLDSETATDESITGSHDCRLRWKAWRVPAAGNQPGYALAIVEELTESRIEQRLRQAEKLEAVGRLTGGVAHDFNNLLTGVLLHCDLILAMLEPGHRIRKYAEEIRSAGLQATGLVRQLLEVSRPRTAQVGLLSLNESVAAMRNLLTRLIGENIELKFRLDPNLGLVKLDATQAQQVLLNLVLNARDAMPRGGEITVETRNCHVQVLDGSHPSSPNGALSPDVVPSQDEALPGEAPLPTLLPCALFVVGDNGAGMAAETRAHLFEAFYTTKSDGRGTGLGLATVYDIVTSNGGLIHVASAPDCGARISVLLPLVPGEFSKSRNADVWQSRTNEGELP